MRDYRIDFESIEWESSMPGVRKKAVRSGSKQVRLVEYSKGMEPHWCERGHFGYLLEGRFEIEFADHVSVFETGDGVFIPAGKEHRHRARVLTDVVRVVFVEDV